MSSNEMSVDEMSLDEMSLDEMSFDEMSLDKMSLDKMSFCLFCSMAPYSFELKININPVRLTGQTQRIGEMF
jgi:hypothetical protein